MDSLILDEIIRREGGYVNHSADKGGATNFGITAKTLGAWRKLGRAATPEEVKALTQAEARDIYVYQYIKAPRFDKVRDEALRELLIDSAVHSGPDRAVKWLQEALAVVVDGKIGPMTLSSLEASDASVIYKRVLQRRVKFIGRLITDNPSQAVFAAGWLARLAEFI